MKIGCVMNFDGAFSALQDSEKEQLRAAARELSFDTGEPVIAEGDKVEDLLIIKSGFLRVTRVFMDEMTAEFAGPLGPGEVIGEMSFIDGKGASASLIADGPTVVLAISRDSVMSLIDNDIGFKARFFESLFLDLSRKLRSTNQRVLPVSP